MSFEKLMEQVPALRKAMDVEKSKEEPASSDSDASPKLKGKPVKPIDPATE